MLPHLLAFSFRPMFTCTFSHFMKFTNFAGFRTHNCVIDVCPVCRQIWLQLDIVWWVSMNEAFVLVLTSSEENRTLHTMSPIGSYESVKECLPYEKP
jgi:hypothetical protein